MKRRLRCCNRHLIKVPEVEKKTQNAEILFKRTMPESFQELKENLNPERKKSPVLKKKIKIHPNSEILNENRECQH